MHGGATANGIARFGCCRAFFNAAGKVAACWRRRFRRSFALASLETFALSHFPPVGQLSDKIMHVIYILHLANLQYYWNYYKFNRVIHKLENSNIITIRY